MATTSKQTLPALASVGIDIGKDVFHIVGFDPDGKSFCVGRSNAWHW